MRRQNPNTNIGAFLGAIAFLILFIWTVIEVTCRVVK